MKKIILLLITLFCLTACSEDDSPKTTTLKIEYNDIKFSYVKNTATVEIESDKEWWIENISAGDVIITPTEEEKTAMATGNDYKTTCHWLTVERSAEKIMLSVEENNGIGERDFSVTLATKDSKSTIIGKQEEMLTGGGFDDVIGLSTREVTLNRAGDEVKVETKGKTWWITVIKVDGETSFINNYYNCTKEDSKMNETGYFSKKCGWLNIRMENWTLYLSADENQGEERTFEINLEAGPYFDRITGKQEKR
jgi:hypothetical protein